MSLTSRTIPTEPYCFYIDKNVPGNHNSTFSICPDHSYISGEHFKCPICGRATEVFSRVVGYIRPVQNWNDGKHEEFRLRSTFEKKLDPLTG